MPSKDSYRAVFFVDGLDAYDEAFFDKAVPVDLKWLNEQLERRRDNLNRAQGELIDSTLASSLEPDLLIPFRLARRPIERTRPPFNAEYLLHLFLHQDERDSVIGDLIESYVRVVERFNKRRGDFWFYKQVAFSLFPLVRRSVLKIGGLVWLGRVLRRLIT